jgi:hypothetical protein
MFLYMYFDNYKLLYSLHNIVSNHYVMHVNEDIKPIEDAF